MFEIPEINGQAIDLFRSRKTQRQALLGLRTELLFHMHGSELRERDQYLVVRSPKCPEYLWGNALYLYEEPMLRDLGELRRRFSDEFRDIPGATNVTIAWGCPQSECSCAEAWESQGACLDVSAVLVRQISPIGCVSASAALDVKSCEAKRDWEGAIRNQVLCRPAYFDDRQDDYEKYVRYKFSIFQAIAEKNLGDVLIARKGDLVIGHLAFMASNGLACVQMAGTNPAFRRQGICTSLIAECLDRLSASYEASSVAILADPDSPAFHLYRSVGFTPAEGMVVLYAGNANKKAE